MPKFDLYAGVWHPEYQGCYEFANLEEATDRARELAIDEYQSYEGSHGVLSYDECCEDWTDSDFEDFYNETIESTVSYYAKAVV